MIDQPDQPEPFGHRHDVGRQQHLAIVLLHADQALVESGITRAGIHHRLERHGDAAIVERGDDLVGDANIHPALGIALDIRPPQRKRTGATAFGERRAFLRAVDRFIRAASVTRHGDGADRGCYRERAPIWSAPPRREWRPGTAPPQRSYRRRCSSSAPARTCCRRSGRARRRRASERECVPATSESTASATSKPNASLMRAR